MSLAAIPAAAPANTIVASGDKLAAFELSGTEFTSSSITLSADAPDRTDSSGPAEGKTYRYGTATWRIDQPERPFDQIVVSWNADTPEGTWVIIEARATVDGAPTKWYNLGWWALDNGTIVRTSVKRQNDEQGRVDTDTIFLSQPATPAEVRFTLCSVRDGVSPALKLAAVDLSTGGKRGSSLVGKSVRGVSLPVPEISQLSYPPRGNVWCSATSTTMVLNYWAEKLGRPDLETNVRDAAAAIHDDAWGGTGNWTFNTAFAGTKQGMVAYCSRMNGFSEAWPWIRAGVPVILSIASNILHTESDNPSGGHLIVCIGFNEKGDVICNDPYAKLDKGQSVRRVYNRARLLKSWSASGRTAYLIYPADMPKR